MPITRAVLESFVVARTAAWVVLCKISATPLVDGYPRAWMHDPIGFAVRNSGGKTFNIAAPTDEDVQSVPDANIDQAMDLCELRLLETCLGNFARTNVTAGEIRQDWAVLYKQMCDRVISLRKRTASLWNIGGEVGTQGGAGTSTVGGSGTSGFSRSPTTGFSSSSTGTSSL
jgi:hypothetical protein